MEESVKKCPLCRLENRCKDNIKLDVKEEWCEDGKRMELDCVQYRILVLAVFSLLDFASRTLSTGGCTRNFSSVIIK
jgi:hypothetical protein